MFKRDLYEVLGVASTSSQEEIKRAFRSLARQFHPDVAENTEGSEVRFIQISEAYEVLGNESKRREYDRQFGLGMQSDDYPPYGYEHQRTYGRSCFRGTPPPEYGEPLRNLRGWRCRSFGRQSSMRPGQPYAHARTQSRRGSDLLYDLRITFRQAYQGVSVDISVADEHHAIRVPAGVDTGSVVRVEHGGAPGLRGGEPGDLFLNIVVLDDPFFIRQGKDIHMAVPLSRMEALAGAVIEFPGPGDSIRMTIPPGTVSGTCFRLRGLGFPSLRYGPRGDAYVTVRVNGR